MTQNALQLYSDANIDAIIRVSQDRALHIQDLARIYIQALHDQHTQDICVTSIEDALAQRDTCNERKLVLDAANMGKHERKMGMRDVDYALDRSKRFHADTCEKLRRDRDMHTQELYTLARCLAKDAPCRQVIDTLIRERVKNNASRNKYDEQQCTQLEAYFQHSNKYEAQPTTHSQYSNKYEGAQPMTYSKEANNLRKQMSE